MEFVNLDDLLPDARELTAEESEFGAREAPYVVAHDLRAEAMEDGSAQQQTAVAYYRQILPRLSVACERALELVKPLGAVCPSGLIGWSGAFLHAAQRLSVPVRYVEFWTIRPGHMITTLNRPAVDHDLRVGPKRSDISAPTGSEKSSNFANSGTTRQSGMGHGYETSTVRSVRRSAHPFPGRLRPFFAARAPASSWDRMSLVTVQP